MAVEYEMTLSDYLNVIKRNIIPILLAFITLLIISLAVVAVLPSVYQSKGTILIESQQISKDLVQGAAAVYADERIEVIKQRVLTRENLFKIIEKHKLYEKERKSKTSSEVIDDVRSNILLNLVSADSGKRNNKVTIAFDLIFESGRPDMAYKVSNELITLFLDENVKARTESATEATAFLAEQADALKKELEETEDKVATFKQKNASSLPEHQQLYMTSLERMDNQIKDIERDMRSAQEEVRFLNVELIGAKSGLTDQKQFTPTQSKMSDLDKLKLEYAQLQGVYKEQHPTLQALKAKITALESVSGNDSSKTIETQPTSLQSSDLIVAKIQAQIDAAKSKYDLLAKQKTEVLAKINKQEQDMALAPQVNRELLSLQRDYENAKEKYEEVRSKQLNAKITQNLEEDNKSERFTLIEPPVLPDKPIRPDRLKFSLVAFAASILIPVAFAILLEILNPKVRGVNAISTVMGQSPLIVIPLIMSDSERIKRKKSLLIFTAALLIFIAISLTVIHFSFMPLDILIAKIMSKF